MTDIPPAPVPDQAVTDAAEAMRDNMRYPADTSFANARLRELAGIALEAAAPAIREAERQRIIDAGSVSKCCGAEHHRQPGAYGRWECHACGEPCDLIGTIG